MNLNAVLEYIAEAEGDQIDLLLEAVIAKKRALYPAWEMIYLALPKDDPAERRRTLEWAWKDLTRE